jgi:hypothetical protein
MRFLAAHACCMPQRKNVCSSQARCPGMDTSHRSSRACRNANAPYASDRNAALTWPQEDRQTDRTAGRPASYFKVTVRCALFRVDVVTFSSTPQPNAYLCTSKAKKWGELTPWRKFLFQKITVSQLIKKFPSFYRTLKFLTTFITAHHPFLFWTAWIHLISSHSVSLRYILILSSHFRLVLPSGLFPSRFSTKIVCELPHVSWPCACSTELTNLDLIIIIIILKQ